MRCFGSIGHRIHRGHAERQLLPPPVAADLCPEASGGFSFPVASKDDFVQMRGS